MILPPDMRPRLDRCLLAVLLVMGGCLAPRVERANLRGDMMRLERDIRTLEEVGDFGRAQLSERLEAAEAEIERLSGALAALTEEEGAIAVVTAEAEALRTQLDDTQRQLSRMRRTVHDILLGHLAMPGPGAAEVEQVAGKRIPGDPGAHLALGDKFLADGDFDAARQTLTLFLHRHKDHDEAWRALFAVGQAHFAQAKASKGDMRDEGYRQAIVAYQRLLVAYPRTPSADEALYKIGLAFEALGHDTDARLFYQELVNAFPTSSFVDKARKRM